ncbi:MAG: M20/M25/M40 family metallo-hydrolase [Saprospiraceae bacterium]
MNSFSRKTFLFLIVICVATSCKTQNKSTTQKAPVISQNKNIPSKNQVDSTQIMADIKHLASDELEGRRSGEKGNALAREYIVTRFQKLGLEKVDTSFLQPFSFYKRIYKKTYNCNNVIGKITGTKHPEKYIVLTAHYDHLGKREEKIFNGADDNASGVSAVLAAAAYFKKTPPKHSILFVAFDAEELGLEGAKHFVDNPPISINNILMNVNLDMISRNKKSEIYICGTHHYPILKEKLTSINSLSSLNVLFGHDTPDLGYNDWTGASDHGPFHKKKIPFIYLGVEDHEDYHKQTDTFERIDPSFLYQSTRLVLEILKAFDR